MAISRLNLASSFGDQTVSNLKFVVHGTSNSADAAAFLRGGLKFAEGQPTVSSNLIYAYDWTVKSQAAAQSSVPAAGVAAGTAGPGTPGSVILSIVPPQFHVGYGIFTSAWVDRSLRKVGGAPLRYAAGRKQLAYFMTPDVEAARMDIENEVSQGYPIESRPEFILGPEYIVGSFLPGEGFATLVRQVDVAIRSFSPIETEHFQRAFLDVFRPLGEDRSMLAPAAIRDVIAATVESVIMSRVRVMRWQGLRLLGYSFNEGEQPVDIAGVKDEAEHRSRIDEFGRQLASSALFDGELAWLKNYAAMELRLMRVELDGSELLQQPD